MSQGSRLENKVPYQGYPYARARPIVTEVAPASNSEDNSPRPQDETNSRLELSSREEKLPYQGFPYVNRIVTDTRTLTTEELAALAKWQNLPRRQLGHTIDGGRDQNSTNPVVYIDLPEESTNIPIGDPPNHSTSKPDIDLDRPVVYIDIPQGSSGMTDRSPDQNTQNTDLQADSSQLDRPAGPKSNLDEDIPVVYIDIPENSESGVSQTIEEEEPAYVQDTILYDPFKDRRIELPQDSDSEGSPGQGFRPGQSRPAPPNTLNIAIPGSSGFGSSTSSLAHSSYATFQSRETNIYGQTPAPNDEFPLSPIPVNSSPNDYPAYPPPYQEIDERQASSTSPTTQVTPQTVPVAEQPRTQVIINPPSPTITVMDGRRKLVRCQHCSATVQTLVVEENGFYTHLLACLICVLVLPLVICVYCTDIFKYRNHYCPVCNKKIGYEDPTCCSNSNSITYVN